MGQNRKTLLGTSLFCVVATSQAVSNTAGAQQTGSPSSHPYVVAVQAPARRLCEVNGGGNRNYITADDEGVVRFYPPTSWGTVLQVNCEPPGSNLTIDLNDPTTFTAEPTDRPVGIKGTRGPLVGDPLSYSQADLRKGHFPQRPDPVAQPSQYARWLRAVSTSADHLDLVGIADLEAPPAASPPHYLKTENNGPNWSGQILLGQSQTYYLHAWINILGSQEPTDGRASDVSNHVPTAASSVWVGIGGDLIDTTTDFNLIQTGLYANSGYPSFQREAFYEYYQAAKPGSGGPAWVGPPMMVPGFNFSDDIEYDAYATDGTGSVYILTGGWGGFYWYDYTAKFYVEFVSKQVLPPSFPGWTGLEGMTAESIAERPGNPSLPLDEYNSTWVEPGAYGCPYPIVPSDALCTGRTDATDTWVFMNMVNPSTNNYLSVAYFPGLMANPNNWNGTPTQDSPSLFLEWQNWQ